MVPVIIGEAKPTPDTQTADKPTPPAPSPPEPPNKCTRPAAIDHRPTQRCHKQGPTHLSPTKIPPEDRHNRPKSGTLPYLQFTSIMEYGWFSDHADMIWTTVKGSGQLQKVFGSGVGLTNIISVANQSDASRNTAGGCRS